VQGLEKVAVRSMDLSENGALGTSGVARLVGVLGRGVKSVSLKGTGLGLAAGQGSQYHGQQRLPCSGEDWTRLEGALGGLAALETIDLSENGALGTSGAARLVGVLGRGVKSVSLKGTGLGLAAFQVSQYHGQLCLPCSGEDWTRLEGALGGLAALEAIDLSENGALGTSGASRLLWGLGRKVKSVSLKGTGLGLAAGQVSQYHGRQLLPCSRDDWTIFEVALGGLEALEAIDLSNNGSLGTSGAARLIGGFGAKVKSVSLRGTGLGRDTVQNISSSGEDWTRLEGALGGLAALEAIDLSENGALGTSGAARLVGVLGRGVKSVSLKGTGLGLAAFQVSQYHGQHKVLACSGEDLTRLEEALGGLSALYAIDLSNNGALGTSGVGRLVSSCAGELIDFVIQILSFLCVSVTLCCRELAPFAVWRQREGSSPDCD